MGSLAVRSTLLVLALVCGLLSSPAGAQDTPSEVAGYRAGILCSAVFLAGRDPVDVLREELDGLEPRTPAVGVPEVDREHGAVTCSYEGSARPRLAVFREGFGTVLLPEGATLPDADALPHNRVKVTLPPGDPARIPWPDGDLLTAAPLPPEVDAGKLDQALEAAFSGEKYAPHKTLGVVVVYRGHIVAERYAPGWSMHTQYRSWSSAKSITSALVGILVGQGKLDPQQPAKVPEWRQEGDSRAEITLEDLLHMSSGLISTGSNTPRGYWGGIDTAAEVAKLQLEVKPGTRWEYSNYDTLLLVRSIKETLGDLESYLTFPRRALLDRIGMRHTFPETDPYGNFILSSQMYTTPRDLARFGLLYLNDGVWQGERILPEGWVKYTQEPAPARRPDATRDWGYGKQFWLLGHDPRVPADTYTTAGHRGQHSTIVPSRGVVIARTGLDPRQGAAGWDQVELVKDVLAAIGATD